MAPHCSVAVGHHVHRSVAAAAVELKRYIAFTVHHRNNGNRNNGVSGSDVRDVALAPGFRSLRRGRAEPLTLDVPVTVRQDLVVAGAGHRRRNLSAAVVSLPALEKQNARNGTVTLLRSQHRHEVYKCSL